MFVRSLYFSLQSAPAARLGPEVQGILAILHLPSGQTDPADLWDQAHHLRPEEVTIGRYKGLVVQIR